VACSGADIKSDHRMIGILKFRGKRVANRNKNKTNNISSLNNSMKMLKFDKYMKLNNNNNNNNKRENIDD